MLGAAGYRAIEIVFGDGHRDRASLLCFPDFNPRYYELVLTGILPAVSASCLWLTGKWLRR